jgi:repressor LexA
VRDLTERQRAILRSVRGYTEAYCYPPSMRNIKEELGISSLSVVSYNLDVLEARGLVYRNRRQARSILLTPSARAELATA